MPMEDMKKIEWEEKEEIVLQKDHIKPTKEFVSPESLYEELVASVRRYHPSTDISLIEMLRPLSKAAALRSLHDFSSYHSLFSHTTYIINITAYFQITHTSSL